jgi:vacuolar protein sorting-associated protein 3
MRYVFFLAYLPLSLCDGDLVDEYFPGFDFIVEKLAQLNDHQLVWQYVDWAMSKQQSKAVEIFTKRANDELTSERMRTETILEYLQNYKEALAVYLEHLIYKKNIKVCCCCCSSSSSKSINQHSYLI